MTEYWRDLCATCGSMSKPVRYTFALMCLVPGFLSVPMALYMVKLTTQVSAQFDLIRAASSGIKLDQETLDTVITNLFAASPAMTYLFISIFVVAAIGNILFLMMSRAGAVSMRNGEKDIVDPAFVAKV